MAKKQIVKVIAFCLMVCLLLTFLCDMFEYENTKNFDRRFYTYRTFEEDTIDAVFLGTSGIDRYWLAAKAYEEHGMTVYPLSSDSMPSWLYPNVMEYALEYQNPKLIMVDVRAFTKADTTDEGERESMDIRSRRVLDSMRFGSKVWFNAALKTMKTIHEKDATKPAFDISYLLSVVRYHQKWNDDDYSFKKNFGSKIHQYAGFYMDKNLTATVSPKDPIKYDTGIEKIDPSCEKAFYEVIEYAKKRNVKLLFVDTPQLKSGREMLRTNYVLELIKKEKVDLITWDYIDGNGNLAFNMGLDLKTDFYNSGHVNFWGAQKFTDEFAQYLLANYEFKDRRDDEACKKYWDGRYDIIKSKVDEWI